MTDRPRPAALEIQAWLVAYLARELGVAPASLDVNARLFDLGLGSRKAVILAGDLEDWLDTSLPPDVTWEHPSIAALASHLAGAEAGA